MQNVTNIYKTTEAAETSHWNAASIWYLRTTAMKPSFFALQSLSSQERAPPTRLDRLDRGVGSGGYRPSFSTCEI